MTPEGIPFGPMDMVMGALLETWDHRYKFECDRKARYIQFWKPPDITVIAKELPDGNIHIVYQPSPNEFTEVSCSSLQAAEFLDALIFRESLTPVPAPCDPAVPNAQRLTTRMRGLFRRFFGKE